LDIIEMLVGTLLQILGFGHNMATCEDFHTALEGVLETDDALAFGCCGVVGVETATGFAGPPRSPETVEAINVFDTDHHVLVGSAFEGLAHSVGVVTKEFLDGGDAAAGKEDFQQGAKIHVGSVGEIRKKGSGHLLSLELGTSVEDRKKGVALEAGTAEGKGKISHDVRVARREGYVCRWAVILILASSYFNF
jgi:hypothetical protein